MRTTTIVLLTSALLLTACGNKPAVSPTAGTGEVIAEPLMAETKHNAKVEAEVDVKADDSYEMAVEFQRQYLPIVEAEMKKLFPSDNPAVDAFAPFGVYYIDAVGKKDMSEMKIVYLIDDMDRPTIQTLMKDLKARMGEHVEFRQSKHTQAELMAVQDKILKGFEERPPEGGFGVGIDTKAEKVRVHAFLDEERQRELIETYGADWIEIEVYQTRDDLTGYVVDKKEDSILVVDPVTRDPDSGNQLYAATWYSNAPANIEIGHKVTVSIIGGPRTLQYQYPDVDTAYEVKVLPSAPAEGAVLTEAEAIRRALNAITPPSDPASLRGWTSVVKEARFDAAMFKWTVLLTQSNTDTIETVEVADER